MGRLGPDRRASLKLFLTTLHLAVLHRRGRVSERLISLRIASYGGEIELMVGDIDDMHALLATFAAEEYELDSGSSPALILDLGSHIGDSVAYFHLRYPGARIVAYEPNPRSFRKLERNIKQIPGAVAHQAAVAGSDGEVRFVISDNSLAAATGDRGGDDPEGNISVTVRARSLDSILDELGGDPVDLLKIDIEGAEYEVLRSCTKLDRVRTIIGEFHPTFAGVGAEELSRVLEGFEVEIAPHAAGGHYALRARSRA